MVRWFDLTGMRTPSMEYGVFSRKIIPMDYPHGGQTNMATVSEHGILPKIIEKPRAKNIIMFYNLFYVLFNGRLRDLTAYPHCQTKPNPKNFVFWKRCLNWYINDYKGMRRLKNILIVIKHVQYLIRLLETSNSWAKLHPHPGKMNRINILKTWSSSLLYRITHPENIVFGIWMARLHICSSNPAIEQCCFKNCWHVLSIWPSSAAIFLKQSTVPL